MSRTYRLPDDALADWDVLVMRPVVAVVAITEALRFVLVRQFRPGPGQLLLELPGGYIDENEAAVDAAGRELLEETGYVGTVEVVGGCWMAAASTGYKHVAVARDCKRVASPRPDTGEFVSAVELSLEQFRGHLRRGGLTDADAGYMGLIAAGLLA